MTESYCSSKAAKSMEGTQLHYQEQTGYMSRIKTALETATFPIEPYFLKKVATCLRPGTAKNWVGWLK